LRSISEPTQRNAGPFALPAELAACVLRRAWRERNEVDAAVDHVEPFPHRGDPLGEPGGEPARVGDHRRRAADHGAGRRGDAGHLAEVGDVLAVRHHHQGRTGGARGRETGGAGREEEMGEDNFGACAPRRRHRAGDDARVLDRRAAPPADRRDLHLVVLRLELADERHEEAAEVRVLRARPHLGDEQDSHGS
jgi:hypothetical protein